MYGGHREPANAIRRILATSYDEIVSSLSDY